MAARVIVDIVNQRTDILPEKQTSIILQITLSKIFTKCINFKYISQSLNEYFSLLQY
jgi:hypothetical protein